MNVKGKGIAVKGEFRNLSNSHVVLVFSDLDELLPVSILHRYMEIVWYNYFYYDLWIQPNYQIQLYHYLYKYSYTLFYYFYEFYYCIDSD